jgi:hypothetical protein
MKALFITAPQKWEIVDIPAPGLLANPERKLPKVLVSMHS